MQNQKTIEENNILIAEFMGLDWEQFLPSKTVNYLVNGNYYEAHELAYNLSWDWLMPVIEKIEIKGYKFEKNFQRVEKDWQSLIVKGNDIIYQEFNNYSLQCSYYVVLNFIKDYKLTKLFNTLE
jgi:hypothetical protein